MSTGTRARRPADVLRIGEAVSHPGIDPRTWVCTGRVEDDADAVRWDRRLGWIADVTITGGPLDGEQEVPCRIAGVSRDKGTGVFLPIKPGSEVQVAVNSGNPEEGPVIVGTLSNRGGNEVPTAVDGKPIDGSAKNSSEGTISPFDTEIVVSDSNREEEYGGDFNTKVKGRQITAEENAVIKAGKLARLEGLNAEISATIDALVEAKVNAKLSAGAALTLEAGTLLVIKSGTTIQLESGGNVETTAAGTDKLEAVNVEIIAEASAVIETLSAVVAANSISLGSAGAPEAFIKGTSYLAGEVAHYTAVAASFGVLAAAAGVPPSPLAPLAAGFSALQAAYAAAAALAPSYASLKIKGE